MGMAQSVNKTSSSYIAGPIRDTIFLIAAPLVAILVFIPFKASPLLSFPLPEGVTSIDDKSLAIAFINVIIFSHLFIVFFRSHLNPKIFKFYKWRFTIVPLALFAAVSFSVWLLAIVAVIGIWWDVYHSSLQTFGIGRIYDARKGNDALMGRRLDWVLNLILYTGPILAGVSLVSHLMINQEQLEQYLDLEKPFFEWVPATGEYSQILTYSILTLCMLFFIYYFYAYWRLSQRGYKVSYQKVFLYAILALVSITCWGFNSFGEAFFVMNFFHAWQYFFIVWHMEQKNITSFFRLSKYRGGRQIALSIFILTGISFGIWHTIYLDTLQLSTRMMASILLVVSIMHFWYDGFIWSVRKGQVR